MDPKRQILEMLAEGKIKPEEATRLIAALKEKKPARPKQGLFLVMQVVQDDSVLFELRLPLVLVRMGLRLIPRDVMIETRLGPSRLDLQSIKWDEVIEIVSRGDVGEVFNLEVADEDHGTVSVRVYCE